MSGCGRPRSIVVATLAAALALACWLPARAALAAEPPRLLYLNFSDGTETFRQVAVDDAPSNGSSVGMAAPYPAFAWPTVATGATTRTEVVRRVVRQVHEIFLPYNVVVSTTRPPAGPYTMVLIGGKPRDIGLDLNVAGLAYMDCEDVQKSNLVFVFSEAVRGSERALAITIAQEAGHAFGLEHTASRRDVMYPAIDPQQVAFLNEEVNLLGDRICGPTTQNSHARLLQLVGAWPGDAKPVDDGTRADRMPPRLTLLEPGDPTLDPPAMAPLPQPFVVRVEAVDEGGIDRVVLTAGGQRSVLFKPPFEWSLAGFPAGPLDVAITAVDGSDNPQVVTRRLVLEADRGGSLHEPLALGCSVAGPAGPGGRRSAGWSLLLLAALGAIGARACAASRCPL